MTTELKEKTETDMTVDEAWYASIAKIVDELAQIDAVVAEYYAALAAGDEYVAVAAAQEYMHVHNDARRQNLNHKLSAYKDQLNASIDEEKAKLAAANAEAKIGIETQIADLKIRRDDVRLKLEANWNAQRRSLQNAIDVLNVGAARRTTANKPRIGAQIAELQARCDAIDRKVQASRDEMLADWQQDIDTLKAEAAAKDSGAKASLSRRDTKPYRSSSAITFPMGAFADRIAPAPSSLRAVSR